MITGRYSWTSRDLLQSSGLIIRLLDLLGSIRLHKGCVRRSGLIQGRRCSITLQQVSPISPQCYQDKRLILLLYSFWPPWFCRLICSCLWFFLSPNPASVSCQELIQWPTQSHWCSRKCHRLLAEHHSCLPNLKSHIRLLTCLLCSNTSWRHFGGSKLCHERCLGIQCNRNFLLSFDRRL